MASTQRSRKITAITFIVLVIGVLLFAGISAFAQDQAAKRENSEQVLAISSPSSPDSKSSDNNNEQLSQVVDNSEHLREIPTREEDGWKRLSENETVPRGSHVRLNMTSGERWVKVEPSHGERILELLSKIPDADLAERVEAIRKLGSPSSEEFEVAASQLWEDRQRELKLGYNATDANGAPVTEARVTTLCKQLDHPKDVTIDLMEELEELVEDLDEAQTFANTNHHGLRKCLDLLEHEDTTPQIKTLAAGVIGNAIKTTNELQNATIGLNGFGRLLKALKNGVIAETKAIYSLGSLLRGSKEAANEALKHPDFFTQMVTRLLPGKVEKIREKVAALIGDLLMEPEEWCWPAFVDAGICRSHVSFTKAELEQSQHFAYLESIRIKVCEKQEL